MSHYKNAPLSVKRFLLVLLLAGTVSIASGANTGGYDAPYFQADFTQDLNDWSSALVNPALLYRVNQVHLDFDFYRWAVGDNSLGYQNLGLILPIRRNHTIGATVLFGGAPIKKTKIDNNETVEYLGDARYQDIWFIGSYSIHAFPWAMFGLNLKYRVQNRFGEVAYSDFPGIDLGAYFNPLDHFRFGDLGFSLCLQDIIPSQIKWGSTQEITSNRFRAGIRYSLFNDNLVGNVEYVSDNLLGAMYKAFNWDDYTNMFISKDTNGKKEGNDDVQHRLGVHVKYQFIPSLWIKAGWTNNNIPYVGFNVNMIYTLPEMINYVNLDCNIGWSFIEDFYANSDKNDERGVDFLIKLSTDFGPTREQRESKRLYDQLVLAPNDAYSEAMRLYLAGKYWEASFAFGKVISLFPNFHLNDKAANYLGNCYRFLYMDDAARQVYKEALEEYTTSDQRSMYIYGYQSLDYREGKYDDALKNHAFITNLYGDSPIKSDADYLAGEIHFARKNYNVAEQLLGNLKVGDPSYLYAQYTLAIINIENGKEQAAVQNLTNIIKDTTQEASDQSLQDAANLKLGHLYFEMGDKLRNAVESYQRVSEGSSYQDEALLGTAWSWIKVNKPEIALQTIEKLISSFSESPLIPESFLVKGYALMLLKRYPEAVASLDQSLSAAKRSFVTQEDLKAKTSDFDKYVTQFQPIEEKIKKNALRKPTNKTLEERTDLQNEFEKYAKESKEYFKYTLLAKSHARFFLRKDQIVADAEYALAKATRMSATKTDNKQENKLNEQIDKLKKQLDEIKK